MKAWRSMADEMVSVGAHPNARGDSRYALMRQAQGRAGSQLNDIIDALARDEAKENKK